MAIVKITDKEQVTMNSDGSFLITQAKDGTETLYRTSIASVISALKNAGLLNDIPTTTDLKAYVKSVETSDDGIIVYDGNGNKTIITISSGLAFSEIYYDEDTGYLHLYDDNGKDVVEACQIGATGSKAEFITVGDGVTIANALASVEGATDTDYYVIKDDVCHHYKYIETTADGATEATYEWKCIGDTVELADSISDLETELTNTKNSLSAVEESVQDYGNRISDSENDIQDLQDEAENIHTYELGYDYDTNTLSMYADGSTDPQQSFVLPFDTDSVSSVVTVTKITATPLTTLYGDECNIEYIVSAVDSSGDPTGDCTAYWYVANILVKTETVEQGDCSTDISSYLSSGSNTVRLKVVDPNGATASATWIVRAVNMYLTSTFDDKTTYSSDVSFRFTPYGSGISKTVFIYLDGELYYTNTYTSSGVAQSLTIPAEDLGHGSHALSIYCTATVNETEIQSDTLYFDIIFIGDDDTPVIGCAYAEESIMQYSSTTIEYLVYSPSTQTSSITLEIYSVDDDGNVSETPDSSSSLTVDRTTQSWTYKPTDYGKKVLIIACGSVTKEIELTVEEFPYDVSEVDGIAFDFDPNGRSNSDTNYATYENNGYKMSVSDNFDWINGGWKTDSDGNAYFCVKAGTTMSLDYPLFYPDASEKDIKQTGLDFKLIYKATECRDFKAKVMECLSDNIGVSMTASAAEIYTGSETAVAEMPYCEDTYMELEWNITPDSNSGGYAEIFGLIDGDYSKGRVYLSTESFMQSTQAPITFGSEDCDVWIYRFKVYRTYLSDAELIQNRIADAPDATEMAERYTRNDILGEDGELSYSKIQSVLPDLRVILIECPAFTQGKSDSVKNCTVTHIFPSGGNAHSWTAVGVTLKGQGTSSNAYGASGRNMDIKCSEGFEFTTGATSDTYSMTDNSIGVNYFNIKVNVASSENANNACFQDDFNTYQPYLRAARQNDSRVRDTMEFHPCVIFVKETHVDANGNAVSAVEFEDEEWHFYACGDFGNSKKNHDVFGMDYTNPDECIVEISNNTDKICLFKHDGVSFNDDGSADFDTIFEKEGWGDASDDDMEKNGWHNSVEFRYPEDFGLTDAEGTEWSEDDHKAHLQEEFIRLYKFIASTDTSAATGAALSESVTYNGVEYTTDSAEYRTAKFVNEFENYMVKDSVLYHYLYTERHTMVDNRAKNTFWHTSDGLIWDLCFNYDDDTADGNNNEGDLVLSFGLEDVDTIGSANVYNAAAIVGDTNSSTLWTNIRENMYSDLASLYTSLEQGSTNVWSADRVISKFEEYQWVKSERLQMFDMRRKYIRPYEDPTAIYKTDTMYLEDMMYGRKTHQRAQFEKYMEQYTSSKYGGTTARTDSNAIYFRANNPGKIYVTPYCAIYVSAKVGATTYTKRAARGDVIEFDFTGLDLNDTESYIYSAKLVQEVDGLASMYIGSCSFSPAEKLTKLIIGSSDEDYSNLSAFTSLNVSANTLLEVLDIRNCTNFSGSLDLSNCAALKELYTKGTKCSGVTFATGGLVEKAELNAIGSLIAKNLTKLYYGRDDTDDTLSFEDTTSLTTVTVENSDIVFAASVTAGSDTACINAVALFNDCTKISRTRLINMYWRLSSTDLLDKILAMSGLDSTNYNLSQSVLTGYFYVPTLYQSKKESYEAAWGEDDISFGYGSYVKQYSASFYSDYDDDGKPTGLLGVHYVDQGGTDYAPVAAGEFDTPTKDSDAHYSYAFESWYCETNGNTYEDSEDAAWASQVGQNLVYVAQYTPTVRTYTVTYYNTMTEETIKEVTADYGDEVYFDLDTEGYPSYSGGDSGLNFYLFAGWDKSTAFITGDITVNTLWDYVSGSPDTSKDTTEWSLADIHRLAAGYSDDDTMKSLKMDGGTRFTVQMGNDYNFTNVDDLEIISEDTYFDGTEAYIVTDGDGNRIPLFGADSPSFTLALDVTLSGITVTNTIFSCGDLRLKMYYYSGSYRVRIYAGSTVLTELDTTTQRNMFVFRHEAGSETLKIALFNNTIYSNGYADAISEYEVSFSSFAASNAPLCLGGYLDEDGSFVNKTSDTPGQGFIHWCKLWYADLGDQTTADLAAWTREKHIFGLTITTDGSFRRYPLSDEDIDDVQNYAKLTFQMIDQLPMGHKMNTNNVNSGGWDACLMRQFLNPANKDCESGFGRFWKGLPVGLRAMIVKVQTVASIGDQSTSTTVSKDFITLASYQENNAATLTTSPYFWEGSYYNIFMGSDNRFKIRFRGLVIPEDATYYAAAASSNALSCEVALTDATQDPTAAANAVDGKTITVKEGDIWIEKSSSVGYYYVTKETYERYALNTGYWATSSDYVVQAEDGSGYWLRSATWWERSANVSYSTYFLYVYANGSAGTNSNANSVYGVCPCFSIGS